MAEMTEEQKQEAAARTERERQEAAQAQPPVKQTPAGSGTQLTGESPEEMKTRLNEEAKRSREALEASQSRTQALEAEMLAMRAKAEEEQKERERAEMTAIDAAKAKSKDLEELLATERTARNVLTVKDAATQLAAQKGFKDPTMAAKMVDMATVVGADGQIDMPALEVQVDALATNYAYLLNQPPPAALTGPTKNPPNVAPEVLAPSSVNLHAGQDPRMALMEDVKNAKDAMRDGRDPRAASNYVDKYMKLRASNQDAVNGGMYRDKNVPLKERGG